VGRSDPCRELLTEQEKRRLLRVKARHLVEHIDAAIKRQQAFTLRHRLDEPSERR
jgi:hypothetical protein